ncbi:hypothetical protein CsSME_00053632 [Camellia sinensis var. sinensis]
MANLGSSSDLNMDNQREEIRQGKQQSCTTATSLQKSEQEIREPMPSILIPISPRTSQQVKRNPKAKVREPPDRNGGRMRELSNREAYPEHAQSLVNACTRQRSVSPRHCRMPGVALHSINTNIVNGGQPEGTGNKKFRRNMRELV